MTALFAPTLQGLVHYLSFDHVHVGAAGERLVYELLEASGYRVSNTHPGEHRGDLRVVTRDGEVLHVEVKTARENADGKWHFTLFKRGKTDHRASDLVILVCVLRTGFVVPFVVPTAALCDLRAVAIASEPSRYAGKLACYRQSLHALSLDVAL